MAGFLLRIIINTVVLLVIVVKLPGFFVDTLGSTLLGAAIIGLANAAIRTVFSLFSAPFDLVTLGSCTFLTNLVAPLMVIKTVPGCQISSFFASVLGVLLITICSYTLSKNIHDR
ncbi:MAG: Mycobacterial 4 phage holin, superfamily [Firmicutes bacterium]|nr:Mycobacterial 4 phage holin, superfamily [Bacillota bacterium]